MVSSGYILLEGDFIASGSFFCFPLYKKFYKQRVINHGHKLMTISGSLEDSTHVDNQDQKINKN